MDQDGEGSEPERGLGVSFVVAGVLLVPGVFFGLSALTTPGGGAIDAVGVLVGWAAVVGSLVGAITGGMVAALPRTGGMGCLAGLVAGVVAAGLAAAATFMAVIGG